VVLSVSRRARLRLTGRIPKCFKLSGMDN
jgi:hypothetical protein